MADPPSPTGVGTATVVCSDEQDDVAVDASRWSALATAVLAAEGVSGELTLTFVDPSEIASLNAEHMGVSGPTDVLAFPLDGAVAGGVDGGGDGAPPALLGDIVVCPAIAAAAAPEHGGSVDDELALLVVHGVLHVLGHDHSEPCAAASMREHERRLLSALHWHGPVPATFHQEQPDP